MVERDCYDLEELLSDVGGILAIVVGGLKIITDYFAELRTMAIFAERGYMGE